MTDKQYEKFFQQCNVIECIKKLQSLRSSYGGAAGF